MLKLCLFREGKKQESDTLEKQSLLLHCLFTFLSFSFLWERNKTQNKGVISQIFLHYKVFNIGEQKRGAVFRKPEQNTIFIHYVHYIQCFCFKVFSTHSCLPQCSVHMPQYPHSGDERGGKVRCFPGGRKKEGLLKKKKKKRVQAKRFYKRCSHCVFPLLHFKQVDCEAFLLAQNPKLLNDSCSSSNCTQAQETHNRGFNWENRGYEWETKWNSHTINQLDNGN